ncbi:hypothetical protein V8E55_008008 [Tylopilus felleus]
MAVSPPVVSASSDGQSPPSDDGSASPHCNPGFSPKYPTDGTSSAPQSASSNAAAPQPKRKPSRRANTGNLGPQILDLAALLPNLSQIRRPSKFAIINSSIAYIYASRELRILKLESDALRRELNEWRDWAGLRDGFTVVLIEVLATTVAEEDDEAQGQFDGFEEGEEELSGPLP